MPIYKKMSMAYRSPRSHEFDADGNRTSERVPHRRRRDHAVVKAGQLIRVGVTIDLHPHVNYYKSRRSGLLSGASPSRRRRWTSCHLGPDHHAR